MKQTRRKFTAEFKAKVALEAIKEHQTLAELAKRYEVSPVMISRWKKDFLENMGRVFGGSNTPEETSVDVDRLYAQIGQLKVENDFLKKSLKKAGL